MKKCKICNKYIPYENNCFEEYFVLNSKLKKFKNNADFKYQFFLKLINNLESKIGYNLCLCIEDEIWKEKENYLRKILKNKEKLKKEDILNVSLFENNYKINIVKNRFDYKTLKEIIKKEKQNLTFKYNISHLIISYNELIDKLKFIYDNKDIPLLEEIKNVSILTIYDFNELFKDKDKEYYFYDEKIKDILEYRYINNLKTYII